VSKVCSWFSLDRIDKYKEEAELILAQPGAPYPGLDKTVELKTNKVIRNPRQEAVFHK